MDKTLDTKNKLDDGLSFKVSRFKEVIKKTRPHKHDAYFELILLREGEGYHCIETDKYFVSCPEFYFLKPGQLHYWEFTSTPKGFVILFNEKAFDAINDTVLIDLLTQLKKYSRISLPQNDFLWSVLHEMYIEFAHQKNFSPEILKGLLKAIAGKLLQLANEQNHHTTHTLSIFDKYMQLLSNSYPQLRKVNEYAQELNTTPQNLNAVCKKNSNKNAGEHLNNRGLIESKRYLLHTDNTINEIAEILHFSDASNFIKYFKKNTGFTPAQFRQHYFQ